MIWPLTRTLARVTTIALLELAHEILAWLLLLPVGLVRGKPLLPYLALLRAKESPQRFTAAVRSQVRKALGPRSSRELRPAGDARLDRLRILVLSARVPRLDTDGSWIVVQRLAALAKRHHVEVVCLADEGADAGAEGALARHGIHVKLVRRPPRAPGVDLHSLVPKRLREHYSSPALRDEVLEWVAAASFDVVQVEYLEMAYLLRGQLEGVPAVYTCHEPLGLAVEREATGPLGWYWRWQALHHELSCLRQFRHVVTLSDADQRWLAPHLPQVPITTISSGIDTGRFAVPEGREPDPATVLFVGYYRHGPNVDAARWLAREVMPRVRRSVPAATLRLVGRDPGEEVKGLAGDGVVVTGFVPDLAAELARATVVAAPLRAGGGLRGKLLEAWAARRALVATTIACEGFAVEPGREALVADDAESFAQALVRVLSDHALRRSLGEAGHALVAARYSVEAAAEGFERVHAQVLAR
jgi:glycosyltransferase involved in cell wall biosynthesis